MSPFDVNMPVAQRIENLLEMMQRLGIGPVTPPRGAAEQVVASAVRACEACADGEICRDWLAYAPPTFDQAPPFCPNAGRFAKLLAEMESRHA